MSLLSQPIALVLGILHHHRAILLKVRLLFEDEPVRRLISCGKSLPVGFEESSGGHMTAEGQIEQQSTLRRVIFLATVVSDLVAAYLQVSSRRIGDVATLWRGFVKALARRGHTLSFYEKDVPYHTV
jgi:hypothetical protein